MTPSCPVVRPPLPWPTSLRSRVVSPHIAANDINDLTLCFPRRSGGLLALLLPTPSLARFPAAPSALSEHHIRDHQRGAHPKTAADLRPNAFLSGCQQDVADSVALAESCTLRASPIFKKNSSVPPAPDTSPPPKNEKKKGNQRESLEKNLPRVPQGFLVIGYDPRNLHGHILKLVADLLRRRRRQAAAGNALGGVFRLSAGVNQKGSHQNLKDKVA